MKKYTLIIKIVRIQCLTIFYVCWGVFFMVLVSPASAYEFPPYEGLEFKITGNLSENYSNNITFAKDDENKVEQFTTMMTFGGDVNYEGKRGAFGLGGQISQPIRFDDSDVRNSSEIFTLKFLNEFSEYDRISIRNTYTHTRVPGRFVEINFREKCMNLFDVARDDPICDEFEAEFGSETGAFDSYNNNFSFNYTNDLSDFIGINVGYGHSMYWSSREGQRDSNRNSVNLKVNYYYNYATNLSLSYGYSETKYEEGGNISTDSIKAGIKQYITKRLYFDGNVGMVFAPSADTIAIDAVITGEIDEKTNANISFSRDIRAAVDREDVFRSWRVDGRFSRVLMEKMNGFVSVFYGQGDFVSDDVTDTLLGASVSFNYNFWQHKRGARISGTLGYTYSILDSTDENRGYNRSAVNSSLNAAF